ncbi:MAG TPA: hypothetical protein VKZ18_17835 [Polyangia bacterium]|nr:hypothetical protein [Polyangia bacterium]
MFGAISVVLGFGLIILWVAGLSAHAVGWLTWIDGIVGLLAIAAGFGILRAATRAGVATSGGLSFALLVIWIIGLAAGSTLWMVWWTFAFACGFLILAAASMSGEGRLHRGLHQRTT